MALVFCTECGYRTYTTSKAISQEACGNCGSQGTYKKVLAERAKLKESHECDWCGEYLPSGLSVWIVGTYIFCSPNCAIENEKQDKRLKWLHH